MSSFETKSDSLILATESLGNGISRLGDGISRLEAKTDALIVAVNDLKLQLERYSGYVSIIPPAEVVFQDSEDSNENKKLLQGSGNPHSTIYSCFRLARRRLKGAASCNILVVCIKVTRIHKSKRSRSHLKSD